jgi:hypothetical protein
MIAKMRINKKQMRSTFVIEGKEARRALTTNLMPSSLDIIRSGLRPLKALNAFKDFIASKLTSNNARP